MPVRGLCRYCGDACLWMQGPDGKPIAQAPDGSRFPCGKRVGHAETHCEPETAGDRMVRGLAQRGSKYRNLGIGPPRKRR